MISRISLLFASVVFAGIAEPGAGEQIWSPANVQSRSVESGMRYFEADDRALRDQLGQVPHEALGDRSHSILLPMPDGSLQAFVIVESPIMEAELATRYPQIKTFKVYGIDDPLASGRVDITPQGFHAMLFTSQGRLFIDPDQSAPQAAMYLSRYRQGQPTTGFSCGIHELDLEDRPTPDTAGKISQRITGQLLEYRLAVAATEEYVVELGGTVMLAQAGIVTAINRVNEIYERDHGIRLTLVANNDQLIENGGNVSFTNSVGFLMLAENQVWIDSVLGSGGYDIGHVFSTGGGGVARLGSTCDNLNKAQGVTGLPNPVGDLFYIDFVSHEIGHQFNADHTFNATTQNCGAGNRNSATAFEPGSGSTIMAYAGICGVENIQLSSDATFHAGSIEQVDSFTGAGGSCFVQIPTNPLNNADPVINAIGDQTIPADTAFALSAVASDAESGMVLTYQWDQLDAGTATDAVSFGSDQGDNALFRSYPPQSLSKRDFPALGTQVQGLYDDAEVIPCTTRSLNFRVTARDNDSGQDTEEVRIDVIDSAGPFRVTSQTNTTSILASNSTFTVTWDVANTSIAPIGCSDVAIELLAFDDAAYTNHSVHPLVASTPNTGTAIIVTPSEWVETPARARLRVSCLNNVFYALSEGDLQFIGNFPKVLFDDDDIPTFFNNNGTTGGVAPICISSGGFPTTGGGSTRDATSVGLIWLLLMSGLALARVTRVIRVDNKS